MQRCCTEELLTICEIHLRSRSNDVSSWRRFCCLGLWKRQLLTSIIVQKMLGESSGEKAGQSSTATLLGSRSPWGHVLYAPEQYHDETCSDLHDIWKVASRTSLPIVQELLGAHFASTHVHLCFVTNNIRSDEPMWTPQSSSSTGSWQWAVLQMSPDNVAVLLRCRPGFSRCIVDCVTWNDWLVREW